MKFVKNYVKQNKVLIFEILFISEKKVLQKSIKVYLTKPIHNKIYG